VAAMRTPDGVTGFARIVGELLVATFGGEAAKRPPVPQEA
jgi:hypothetical protein